MMRMPRDFLILRRRHTGLATILHCDDSVYCRLQAFLVRLITITPTLPLSLSAAPVRRSRRRITQAIFTGLASPTDIARIQPHAAILYARLLSAASQFQRLVASAYSRSWRDFSLMMNLYLIDCFIFSDCRAS